MSDLSLQDFKVGVGLIGCGSFGGLLARALADNDKSTLVAVGDADRTRAQSLAGETGATAADDPLDIAHEPSVGVVFIATPNDQHLVPAVAALQAGRHVFVEKPIAITSRDANSTVSAAAAARASLSIGHVLRTLPGVLRAESIIRSGEIGSIHNARAARLRLIQSSGDRSSWKLDPKRSGGELLHEIHEVDLISWLLGPADSGHLADSASGSTIDLHLKYADGSTASVVVGKQHHRGSWYTTFYGSHGALHIDFGRGLVQQLKAGEPVDTWGVFGDPALDDEVARYSRSPQRYGVIGTAPPRWMRQAVSIEVDHFLTSLASGTRNVLSEAPADAVIAIESAKAGSASAPEGAGGRI